MGTCESKEILVHKTSLAPLQVKQKIPAFRTTGQDPDTPLPIWLPPEQTLINELNKRNVNRVLHDVGLCICVFDVAENHLCANRHFPDIQSVVKSGTFVEP